MSDKNTSRPTGKSCHCGGKIIELFSRKHEKLSMSSSIGRKTSWVSSDGFCCEECGILYGGIKFPKTILENIPEDVKSEL